MNVSLCTAHQGGEQLPHCTPWTHAQHPFQCHKNRAFTYVAVNITALFQAGW